MKTYSRKQNSLFDFNAISILLSFLALMGASHVSKASSQISSPAFNFSLDSVVTDNLKSCSIPYSEEYCRHETSGINECKQDSYSWLSILDKSGLQNSKYGPLCPPMNTFRTQKNES